MAFHDKTTKMINDFIRKFKELQLARTEGTTVQATIVTYKVLSTVTDIRELFPAISCVQIVHNTFL